MSTVDPVPVTLTDPWTVSYRGLLIGAEDSALSLIEVSGLLDSPALRTADRAILHRHGEMSGPDWMGARTVTLVIEVTARTPSEFDDAMTAVMTAFTPARDSAPLSFRFPGVAGGGPRAVWGKVRHRAVVMDQAYAHRYASVTVELYCPSPLILAATPSSGRASLPRPVPGGGIRFPRRFPLRLGHTTVADVIHADNAGTAHVPVRFTMRGPIRDPRIVDPGTGNELALDYTLTAGQSLVVDTGTRDVMFNGVAPRFVTGRGNVWLTIPPGGCEFALRGTRTDPTGPEPELSALWWPAWI